MSDTTKKVVESLDEYKKGLLKSIAIAIQTTNGDGDYSVGLRNGLRVCKAYIDGLEPEYEKCKPSAPPNCSEIPNNWTPCTPETMPEEAGAYICTCIDAGRLIVTQIKWQPKLKSWNLSGARSYWKVIAWQEIKPYQPKEE